MKNNSKSSIGAAQNTVAPTEISLKIRVLAIAYTCFFLLTLWAAYHNQLPLKWLSQLPNYDKFGHVVLYCMPSYLGHRLCRQKHFRQKHLRQKHLVKNNASLSLPVFPTLFALFTFTEEGMQGLSPYRTLDAGDLVCSLIGITAGYCLAQRFKG
jgi:polysaccharide biosynthesis protein VpsQ